MKLEVTAYSGIGPGIHPVIVTGLEVKPAKLGGDYLRWEFTGDGPDIDGKTTSANSSVEMTPGNKTGKWFAALTGRPTEIGVSRDMAEVIGKPCTIVQELNPEGYPKVIALTSRQVTQAAHTPAALAVAQAEAAPEPLSQAENGSQAGLPTGDLPF